MGSSSAFEIFNKDSVINCNNIEMSDCIDLVINTLTNENLLLSILQKDLLNGSSFRERLSLFLELFHWLDEAQISQHTRSISGKVKYYLKRLYMI